MQSPQSTPVPAEGDIALNETGVQVMSLKLVFTPCPGKEASLVFQSLDSDHERAL